MSVAGRDYIGLGVGAIVANDKGSLFLSRRGRAARNEAGLWEFPGGAVNFGETLQRATVREFDEEYGMRIVVYGLLGVFDHILPREEQHWVSVTYLACRTGGMDQPREPDKCDAAGWFVPTELPTPLTSITQSNLKAWREHSEIVAGFLAWCAERPRTD